VLVELHCKRRELQLLIVRWTRQHHAAGGEDARARGHEPRLKEADRHKDEFLAMLAHELRNPLAPSATRLKSCGVSHGGCAAHLVARCDRAAGETSIRVWWTICSMCRASPAATFNLNRERMALGTVVSRALETVQPLLAEQRHELVLEMPDPTLEIEGDLTRLTQVLGNLLNNAANTPIPTGASP